MSLPCLEPHSGLTLRQTPYNRRVRMVTYCPTQAGEENLCHLERLELLLPLRVLKDLHSSLVGFPSWTWVMAVNFILRPSHKIGPLHLYWRMTKSLCVPRFLPLLFLAHSQWIIQKLQDLGFVMQVVPREPKRSSRTCCPTGNPSILSRMSFINMPQRLNALCVISCNPSSSSGSPSRLPSLHYCRL